MNLNEYSEILTICFGENLKSSKKAYCIQRLFDAACRTKANNTTDIPQRDTISRWLSREKKDGIKPPINYTRYFPDGKITEKGKESLFSIFSKYLYNIDIKRSEIKQYINKKAIDSFIDIETDNDNMFIVSMIRQFAILFNLEDISYTDTVFPTSCEIKAVDATDPSTQDTETDITDDIIANETEPCSQNDISASDNKVVYYSTITVPNEYQKCKFCKYWVAILDGVNSSLGCSGKCRYSENVNNCFSDQSSCSVFDANYSKINKEVVRGKKGLYKP